MKTKPDNSRQMVGEIEATEERLEALEELLLEIGEPASSNLRQRLEALKVEERALLRNFAEMQRTRKSKADKLRKIETLLHHIEAEETSIEHDGQFLHQGSLTSLELAYRGGSRLFDYGARGYRRVVGDRQLMWHSPFVNNTHDTLSTRYRMPTSRD